MRRFGAVLWAALMLGACASGGGVRGSGNRAARPPNVILILADDLGYGELSVFGQKLIRTPHLDRLASEGTRYTAAYAGAPVCAPSRSVLLTGQHAGHTRVRGNTPIAGPHKGGRVPLHPEDVTVAEVMKAAGYATGAFGKWGLGDPGSDGVPTRQGFDEWFGYLNQRHAHDHFTDHLYENEARFELPQNVERGRGVYVPDLFVARALDFMGRHKDRPFFLYLPLTLPHGAYDTPGIDPTYAGQTWPQEAKHFATMVARLDRDVGRLLEQLSRLGLAQDTVVVFTSDNGTSDIVHKWRLFDSSGPLRGHKRDMFEGGLRVPTIVRWPGRVPAGQVNDQPWTHADLLPTFAALAGVAPPPGIDGQDLLPLFTGRLATLPERFLYFEFHEGGFTQAARRGRWKTIRPGPGEPLQVYDLERDLGEQEDVAGRHPEVVRMFEDHLATARTESEGWPIRPRRVTAAP